jgi:hypothetical protein
LPESSGLQVDLCGKCKLMKAIMARIVLILQHRPSRQKMIIKNGLTTKRLAILFEIASYNYS